MVGGVSLCLGRQEKELYFFHAGSQYAVIISVDTKGKSEKNRWYC